MLLHAFKHRLLRTQRRFYTPTLLHVDSFTHTDTHQHFYTQPPLHTDTFTWGHFYTQTLLQTDAFTHRRLYTPTLLHFTHSRLYTERHLKIAILLMFLMSDPHLVRKGVRAITENKSFTSVLQHILQPNVDNTDNTSMGTTHVAAQIHTSPQHNFTTTNRKLTHPMNHARSSFRRTSTATPKNNSGVFKVFASIKLNTDAKIILLGFNARAT